MILRAAVLRHGFGMAQQVQNAHRRPRLLVGDTG
jgi:hypothetical protein